MTEDEPKAMKSNCNALKITPTPIRASRVRKRDGHPPMAMLLLHMLKAMRECLEPERLRGVVVCVLDVVLNYMMSPARDV